MRVHQQDTADESYKQAIEQITREKAEEIRKLEQELNAKSDQLIHFQQQMDSEDDKLAQYEAEKNKISEELGILQDTFNYQQQEMADKVAQLEDF